MAATPAAPVAPAPHDVDMQADVAEIKERVAWLESQIPHLATKVDLREEIGRLQEQIGRIESQFPHFATKADLREEIGRLQEQIGRIESQFPHFATKADLADLGTRLERAMRLQTYWLVGTLIAVGGLIFAGIKLL